MGKKLVMSVNWNKNQNFIFPVTGAGEKIFLTHFKHFSTTCDCIYKLMNHVKQKKKESAVEVERDVLAPPVGQMFS